MRLRVLFLEECEINNFKFHKEKNICGRAKMIKVNLKNKISVITGAASGMGLATAWAFFKNGSDVIMIDRDAEKGKTAADSMNKYKAENNLLNKAAFFYCDVKDYDNVKKTCFEILRDYKKVDVLFLNAGTDLQEPFESMKIENWDNVLKINLFGPFYFISCLIDSMLSNKKGNIIVTSTSATRTGAGGGVHYTVSKAGIEGLAKRINYEFLSRGIRANMISPGTFDTPLLRTKYPDTEEVNKKLNAQVPVGRIGKPDDIANLALFLASDESEFICGQNILIDGGRTFYAHPAGAKIDANK
jgi:3-oxoacyl-[acyl-carrier protein] reductase